MQVLILIDPPVQLCPPFLACWTISRVAVIWPGAQAAEQVDHVRLHAPHLQSTERDKDISASLHLPTNIVR